MRLKLSIKLIGITALCAVLFSVPVVLASNTPDQRTQLAGVDVGDAYCVGKNLQIDLEITINTNLYRVNGTGPNLPSSEIQYPGSFTFVINGPGNWSGMVLEYSSDGGATWSLSYRLVTPDTISCSAPQPAPEPTLPPVPGPDMVDIPAGSVVGTFTQDTTLLFDPSATSQTDSTLHAGQSLWVIGLDSTGQYYQVLLSGVFYWVPVGSLGPNYDGVWNGTPLPTTTVE
jgi:hypothetical protein